MFQLQYKLLYPTLPPSIQCLHLNLKRNNIEEKESQNLFKWISQLKNLTSLSLEAKESTLLMLDGMDLTHLSVTLRKLDLIGSLGEGDNVYGFEDFAIRFLIRVLTLMKVLEYLHLEKISINEMILINAGLLQNIKHFKYIPFPNVGVNGGFLFSWEIGPSNLKFYLEADSINCFTSYPKSIIQSLQSQAKGQLNVDCTFKIENSLPVLYDLDAGILGQCLRSLGPLQKFSLVTCGYYIVEIPPHSLIELTRSYLTLQELSITFEYGGCSNISFISKYPNLQKISFDFNIRFSKFEADFSISAKSLKDVELTVRNDMYDKSDWRGLLSSLGCLVALQRLVIIFKWYEK
eukprot:TRINITY_DN7738_c0_g1_i6.p1 TRINITY_DN7738_c0_g1~~TRINITY_DN7738_c0_g1_i6.p1  ORF type:complete len:348 (-),score=11.89 TRINITY_DN7738_c0_g1_i6:251-1294(-)